MLNSRETGVVLNLEILLLSIRYFKNYEQVIPNLNTNPNNLLKPLLFTHEYVTLFLKNI